MDCLNKLQRNQNNKISADLRIEKEYNELSNCLAIFATFVVFILSRDDKKMMGEAFDACDCVHINVDSTGEKVVFDFEIHNYYKLVPKIK